MANTEQALSFARDLEIAALKGVAPPQNWTSEAVRHIKALTAASADEATPVAWIEAEESARGASLDAVIQGMCFSTRWHLGNAKPKTNNPVWPIYTAPQASKPIGQPEPFGYYFKHSIGGNEMSWSFSTDKPDAGGMYIEKIIPLYASNSQPVSGAGMKDDQILDAARFYFDVDAVGWTNVINFYRALSSTPAQQTEEKKGKQQ